MNKTNLFKFKKGMWIKNSNEQLNRSKYSDVIKSKDHTEKEKKRIRM